MTQIVIRHPETGAEYEINEDDFSESEVARTPEGELKSYADAGYQVVSNADGSAYEGDLPQAPPPPEPEPQVGAETVPQGIDAEDEPAAKAKDEDDGKK